MKKNNSTTKGFMILEVLVAASIIAMSVLAASNVAQKSVNVSRQALHASQAAFLLEEGAEVVRINRDNDWANISALTPGVEYYPMFCKASDPISDPRCTVYSSTEFWDLIPMDNTAPYYLTSESRNVGRFIRKITVSDVYRDSVTQDIVSSGGVLDAGTKLITVTVAWDQGSTRVTKTLSFYLADIFS